MALVPAPLLAGVLIAAVLAYAAYRAVCATPLRLAAFYRSRGVRGSPFVPVVGDMPRLRAARARGGEWLHTFLADEIAAHGTVSYLFLGPEFRLRVADPGLARGVLLTHADAFVKPSLLRRMLGPLLGEGLLLAEGEVWRRHRRLMNPAFSHARLAAMVPLMGAAASSVVDRWLARGSGGAGSGGGVAVDMHHDLAAATLAIIGAAAFGMDLDAAEADGVYDALNALLGASQSNVFMLTAFIPGYASLPTPANRAMKRHIGHLRALLSAVIANRRALRADPATSPAPGDQILLDALLDAHDEAAAPADAPAGDAASTAPPLPAAAAVARPPGAGLTDGELFDEAMTMVVAGHETTSQALCWTLLLLARHPEWQARGRAPGGRARGGRPRPPPLRSRPRGQAVAAAGVGVGSALLPPRARRGAHRRARRHHGRRLHGGGGHHRHHRHCRHPPPGVAVARPRYL